MEACYGYVASQNERTQAAVLLFAFYSELILFLCLVLVSRRKLVEELLNVLYWNDLK